MDAASQPRAWKVFLAFAIIYLVWGSTFLAIRVGVREVPPFLLAGMRFLVAGIVLYGWMRARGTASPTAREWGAASFLAVLIFVFDYGLLFWAERRVPSGIAAVMMATIPVFMALGEIVFLRTQRLTLRLGVALLVGMAGVAVLVGHSMSLGEAPVDTAGFRADEREKLIHLERGAEDFFNIVELRDAADRGQRVVPLVFVLLGGSQSGSGNLG